MTKGKELFIKKSVYVYQGKTEEFGRGKKRSGGERKRHAGKEKKRGCNFIKNLTQFDMWAPHIGVKFEFL